MTADLKPDAEGFRYVLMWMNHLLQHTKPPTADASYLIEWRDFTVQAAARVAELELELAELRKELNTEFRSVSD